ncbi:MAG: Hsp20/alpha crystallin family protein, partial [Bacteroidales bacterium]|uniref:Hsp20/alpha crystallin family protein n=1 Tax=Porphyromonas sp. TaxID=1924944 RepID=UPI0029760E79
EALVISIQKKNEETNSEEDSENKAVAKVDEKPIRYLRREFAYQSFVQRLLLPENANKEMISAKMENGMLEVIIPKVKEEVKTPIERMITIG